MRNFKNKLLYISCFMPFLLIFGFRAYAAIVPIGETVGIKIYTDGLIVTEVAPFWGSDGTEVCPARDAGIKAGDIIKSVNGSKVQTSEQFEEMINENEMSLQIERSGETFTAVIDPYPAKDNGLAVGMWVRDSTAGVGTLTCYNDETLEYYALGHAIEDIDTGNIMTVNKGNIQNCTVTGISRSHIGFPGSVSADFDGENIGNIISNSPMGLYGKLDMPIVHSESMEAADIYEIENGSAYILSDVCGEVTAYSVNIEKISDSGERNMVVEITDDTLIEKTGGIVQGMSGAPIIQNNKLIGAVTHVFINNPKKGYGIFAKNFLR